MKYRETTCISSLKTTKIFHVPQRLIVTGKVGNVYGTKLLELYKRNVTEYIIIR